MTSHAILALIFAVPVLIAIPWLWWKQRVRPEEPRADTLLWLGHGFWPAGAPCYRTVCDGEKSWAQALWQGRWIDVEQRAPFGGRWERIFWDDQLTQVIHALQNNGKVTVTAEYANRSEETL